MYNAILKSIEALDRKHPNTIAIFGGAAFVDRTDMNDIVACLDHVVKTARILKWHESDANACRTFCHLAFMDPALIESAIGMRFERLCHMI